MKWRLLYAVFGAAIGYYISRTQNAAVHGELALELHRNRVMADRAERAEKRLEWVDAHVRPTDLLDDIPDAYVDIVEKAIGIRPVLKDKMLFFDRVLTNEQISTVRVIMSALNGKEA